MLDLDQDRDLGRLAGFWAGHYLPYSRLMDYDDLWQEGMIGALRALHVDADDQEQQEQGEPSPSRVLLSLKVRTAVAAALRHLDHWGASTRVHAVDPAALAWTEGTWEVPRLLLDVVSQLPPKERTVIVRFYYGGQDFWYIADALGVQRGTVLGIHREALIRLRRLLDISEPARRPAPVTSDLDAAQVVEMRELRAQGWLYRDLAERYSITRAYCAAICRGVYWADAGGPLADLRDCQRHEEIAPEVFRLRDQGLSQRRIAAELSIAQARVSAILLGKAG